MMKTAFNIDRLIQLYKPELLRKPRHLAWLQVCARPLKTAYLKFLSFRTSKLYEATITGEKNRLERALQDKYNSQGIYIIQQSDYLDTAWIWLKTEPVFQEYDFLSSENHEPKEWDYLKTEYDPDVDFSIRVPIALYSKVEELKAWVLKYVLVGKKYKIEIY